MFRTNSGVYEKLIRASIGCNSIYGQQGKRSPGVTLVDFGESRPN